MFTEKERYLANEASLTASLLGNSLNALRKASMQDKGLFYQAFFSLSVGIERLLKMIVIQKYRTEHCGEFPIDMNLRDFGHDLLKLCRYNEIFFQENPLHDKLPVFLNDFAKKNRYYNIDFMINQSVQYDDPLYDWSRVSVEILDFSNERKENRNRQELASIIDSMALIRYYDLEGNVVKSTSEWLNEIETREIVQSYSVQLMFEIITAMVDEVKRLESVQLMMLPILSEFFLCTIIIGKVVISEKRKIG